MTCFIGVKFFCFWYFYQNLGNKNGTLKNLDVYQHDRDSAIRCHAGCGPLFGDGCDIYISDKWDQH